MPRLSSFTCSWFCFRYSKFRSVISSSPRADGRKAPAKINDSIVVNIKPGDREMTFRLFRFFFETDGSAVRSNSTTP